MSKSKMDMFTTSTYFEINYHDFEKLIKEHYSVEFNFVESRECNNDSKHTFIAKKGEIEKYEWDKEEIQRILNGDVSYCGVDVIFNDLCDMGVIEPGNYLVSVCW